MRVGNRTFDQEVICDVEEIRQLIDGDESSVDNDIIPSSGGSK